MVEYNWVKDRKYGVVVATSSNSNHKEIYFTVDATVRAAINNDIKVSLKSQSSKYNLIKKIVGKPTDEIESVSIANDNDKFKHKYKLISAYDVECYITQYQVEKDYDDNFHESIEAEREEEVNQMRDVLIKDKVNLSQDSLIYMLVKKENQIGLLVHKINELKANVQSTNGSVNHMNGKKGSPSPNHKKN